MASSSAPSFKLPPKKIVAVEHPMIIKNIDNGLKTFSTYSSFTDMINPHDYEGSIPLYLRPNDMTGGAILSQNVATDNVVLKLNVPRRTGRKRRKGTQGPFMTPAELGEVESHVPHSDPVSQVTSYARLDNIDKLRRTLQDNINNYKVEVAGTIEQTHRYRGLADFHYSTTHAPFMSMVRDTLLTQNFTKLKDFHMSNERGPLPGGEIIPPPTFTDHVLPYNWLYKQNPTVSYHTDEVTGEGYAYNASISKQLATSYKAADVEVVPQQPLKRLPPDSSPEVINIVAELRKAFELRPLWTRRALGNHLQVSIDIALFKESLPYVCWQFRGGPWRNACIKYGVDPRSDPKYREYQTLFFKIKTEDQLQNADMPWKDARSEYVRRAAGVYTNIDTHLFDGKTLYQDGKFWQICDLRDPILLYVIANGKLRTECDILQDGWYCNGTLAKINAIMRTKISAIQIGRPGIDDIEFAETLKYPEEVIDHICAPPVPDFRGSQEVQDELMRKNPRLIIPAKNTSVKFTTLQTPNLAARKKRLRGDNSEDNSDDDSEDNGDEDDDEDDEDDEEMVIMKQASSVKKAERGGARGRPRGRPRGSGRARGLSRGSPMSVLEDDE